MNYKLVIGLILLDKIIQEIAAICFYFKLIMENGDFPRYVC